MSRRLNSASLGLRLTVFAIIAVAALTGSVVAVAMTACVIVLAWIGVINYTSTTKITSGLTPHIITG